MGTVGGLTTHRKHFASACHVSYSWTTEQANGEQETCSVPADLGDFSVRESHCRLCGLEAAQPYVPLATRRPVSDLCRLQQLRCQINLPPLIDFIHDMIILLIDTLALVQPNEKRCWTVLVVKYVSNTNNIYVVCNCRPIAQRQAFILLLHRELSEWFG